MNHSESERNEQSEAHEGIPPHQEAYVPDPDVELLRTVPESSGLTTPLGRRLAELEVELRDVGENNAAEMVETIRRIVPDYIRPPDEDLGDCVRQIAKVVGDRKIVSNQYQLEAIRIATRIVTEVCRNHEVRMPRKPAGQPQTPPGLGPDYARALAAEHWLGRGFGAYLADKIAAYKGRLHDPLSPSELDAALSRLATGILDQLDYTTYLTMHRQVVPRSPASLERNKETIRSIHEYGQALLENVGPDSSYEQCRANALWEAATRTAAEIVKRSDTSDEQSVAEDNRALRIVWRQRGVLAMMDAMGSARFAEAPAKDVVWTAIQDVMEMRIGRRSGFVVSPAEDPAHDLRREGGDPRSPLDRTEGPKEADESSWGLLAFRKLLRGLFADTAPDTPPIIEPLPPPDRTAVLPPNPPRHAQTFSPLRQLVLCTKLGQRLWIGSQRTGEKELLDALFPTANFIEAMQLQGECIDEYQNLHGTEFVVEGRSVLAIQKAVLRSFGKAVDAGSVAYDTARASLALHTARLLHQNGELGAAGPKK